MWFHQVVCAGLLLTWVLEHSGSPRAPTILALEIALPKRIGSRFLLRKMRRHGLGWLTKSPPALRVLNTWKRDLLWCPLCCLSEKFKSVRKPLYVFRTRHKYFLFLSSQHRVLGFLVGWGREKDIPPSLSGDLQMGFPVWTCWGLSKSPWRNAICFASRALHHQVATFPSPLDLRLPQRLPVDLVPWILLL